MAADFFIHGDTKLDTKGFESAVGKLGSVAKKGFGVIAKATTAAAAALGALTVAGVSYNASMEQYQTAFKTMLGSADAADALTDSLKKLAAQTPLAMTDLANASKTLLAFGSTADEIPDQLKRLGNVAQGNAEALGTMATAFGRIQSNSYASMEEINMMIDQGFNPLNIIAQQTGESMSDLRKRVSDGGVSFEELSEALRIATDEGGQFYNAMENQSKTINGRLSTLKDNAMAFAGELTTGITASFGGLIEQAISWIDQLNQELATNGISGVVAATGNILAEGILMLANAAPSFVETAVSLLGSFVNGIVQSLPQLLPAASQILQTLVGGIIQLAPTVFSALQQIGNMILTAIQSILPNVTTGVATFLQNMLPQLLSFTEGLREKVGELVDIGLQLIQNIWNGIVQALPALIENVPQIITNIAGIINDNFPKILATGLSMIWELIKGIFMAIPDIIAALPQIIEAIVSVFTAFNWISLGSNIITMLKNGITAMKGAVTEAAKGIFETVKSIIANLPSTLQNIGSSAISFLSSGIRGMLSTVIGVAKSVLSGIVNAITSLPSKLFDIGKSAISKVCHAFTSVDWSSIGSNVINGIIGGIGSALGGLVNAAVNAAKSAFEAAKNFLGIHSPSRLFRDEIGKMIPQGMAIGVEADTSKAVNSVQLSAQAMLDKAKSALYANNTPSGSIALAGSTSSAVSVNAALQTTHTTIVEVDGRTLGKVVAPYVDEFLF